MPTHSSTCISVGSIDDASLNNLLNDAWISIDLSRTWLQTYLDHLNQQILELF